MNISKELASEVLKISGSEIEVFEHDKTHIAIVSQGILILTINIYELAYRCKIKALEYGYEIIEEKNQVKVFNNEGKRSARLIGDIKENYKPSRVFDACEWILKNKGNNEK